jgi:dethiobiotin synthetase
MSAYFITGTDTGLGKTLIASILTLALRGYYWKPVSACSAEEMTDLQTVKNLTGLPEQHFYPSSYALQASLSPNQAAEREGVTIDLRLCRLPQHDYPLIVEGAAGVLVPLNQTQCMLDLMVQLKLPVVIVSRGTLGTINHTLLTIEALRRRDVTIHGIIFNGDLNPDNQKNIEEWSGVKTLLHVPTLSTISNASLRAWIAPRAQTIRECFL